MLASAEEVNRGFENLSKNSDVKSQKIEEFSEIWGERNIGMLTEEKLPSEWPVYDGKMEK